MTPPAGRTLLGMVGQSLDDDKAEEAVFIELTGKTSIADFMVIASGTSQRHISVMAERLVKKMKGAGFHSVAVEGLSACDWVLLDLGDVIVHLFVPEVRAFYNLEKLWGPPPRGEPADATASADMIT